MEEISKKTRYQLIIYICIIILITFISFYPSLKNDFTNWDDNYYIEKNIMIQNLSSENTNKIFTSIYLANYHPLTLLVYAAEYHFYGLNPLIYHTFNLILHILNSILAFWIFYILFSKKINIAFFMSILWAIHPLRVESVAWISETKDVMSAFFFLLSILMYLYYIKIDNKKLYYISFVIFILSLLSKAMTITLPLILIIIDYLYSRVKIKDIIKDIFGEKFIFFFISFIFGIIAIIAQKSGGSIENSEGYNFFDNILISSYGFLSYFHKILLPINLSAIYPYPLKINMLPLEYIISPFICILLFTAVMYTGKYTKKIIFGFFFFLILLLPVIKLIPIGNSIISDRYTYIASIGLYYILGEVFIWLHKSNNKKIKSITYGIITIIILLSSCLTYERCFIWKNSITLWSDVISKYPGVNTAYIDRGYEYYSRGEMDKAICDYTEAISIKEDPQVYNDRGNAYDNKGETDKAIEDYTKAISMKKDFSYYYNRAISYEKKDEKEKAINDLSEAIRLNESDYSSYFHRGMILYTIKRYEEAIKDFTAVIELKEDYLDAYYNRAISYYMVGEYKKAMNDIKILQNNNYKVNSKLLSALKKKLN